MREPKSMEEEIVGVILKGVARLKKGNGEIKWETGGRRAEKDCGERQCGGSGKGCEEQN